MAGSGKSNTVSIFNKLGLRPITQCNLIKFYIPAFGVVSYTALSVNVMNPNLAIRIFPKIDVTNVLLGSTLLGTSIYIYKREHMNKAPVQWRVTYSGVGAILLSFGSVLFWAVLRSILPPNPTLCTIAGVSSGTATVIICSSYLNFIDNTHS